MIVSVNTIAAEVPFFALKDKEEVLLLWVEMYQQTYRKILVER